MGNLLFPLFWLAGEVGWWVVPVWYVLSAVICLVVVHYDARQHAKVSV